MPLHRCRTANNRRLYAQRPITLVARKVAKQLILVLGIDNLSRVVPFDNGRFEETSHLLDESERSREGIGSAAWETESGTTSMRP